MFVLGFADSHDAAACLVDDDRIRCAIAVERLSRIKRAALPIDATPPQVRAHWAARQGAILYCCETAGIAPRQIDHICVASPDSANALEIAASGFHIAGAFASDRLIHMPHPEHHLAHAYSAFFTSGFDAAAALIVDSYANPTDTGRVSHTGYCFRNPSDEPATVFEHHKPDRVQGMGGTWNSWKLDSAELSGIGELYRIVTLLLGFYQKRTIYDDAGKTMGLAPYGQLLSKEQVLMRPLPDGHIDFGNAYPFLRGLGLIDAERRLQVRLPGGELTELHRNLAAQVQWELEEALVHLARNLQRETGMRRLVTAGGTFLNAVANHRIRREAGFEDVWTFPAATDDGTAVGAAFYGRQHAARARGAAARTSRVRSVAFGRSYSDDEIAEALAEWPLDFERLDSPHAAARSAGALLAQGKILGWFQGGAEFGPRALGRRSILADPRIPDIRDVLNARVKFREAFRPFAPAVVAESAHEYFDMPEGDESPFMLDVFDVRERHRAALPGITHVDGTARLQTVRCDDDPLFHALIEAYGSATGVPVVLNTSFNLRSMPIVETPFHALCCFLATEMDYLVMGSFVIPTPDRSAWVLAFRSRGTSTSASVDRHLSSPDSDATNAILAGIDGTRSLRDIARAAGLDDERALRMCLELVRRNAVTWVGVPIAVV